MLIGNSDRFILERNTQTERKICKLHLKNIVYTDQLINAKKNILNQRNNQEIITPIKFTNTPFNGDYGDKNRAKKLYSFLLKSQLLPKEKIENKTNTNNNKKNNNFLTKKRIRLLSKKIQNQNRQNKNFLKSNYKFNNQNTSFLNIDLNSDLIQDDNISITDFNLFSKEIIKPYPIRALDAPNLIDDFYIHVLSWSTKNILSVALRNSIFFINLNSTQVSNLCKFQNNEISSLNFLNKPELLLTGLDNGNLYLFDIIKNKNISNTKPHESRIGIIINIPNETNLFSTGSYDTIIKTFDIRENLTKPIFNYKYHSQEITGIKWSPEGEFLLSGGNDNKIIIWDIKKNNIPLHIFNKAHKSAVRALDWNFYKRNIFISGGGVNDRKLKFWNCNSFKLINEIETDSQICDLKFSEISNEFISTHGYNTFAINVWKIYNEDIRLCNSLIGHKNRVLFLATSPEKDSIATGSGDETIRLWKVFNMNSNGFYRKSLLDFDEYLIR